ncbi:TetR/AcrR family transcriptional regulator [Rhodoligotrophos defluvii]|uniref:TetR/AcrR family transcriptional regulator n=1 Tax=Rhodoligotrophos defluvii TaxID=2561934 RepID=UPI0010C9673C|nr:TetR/AcrR family transcriptional regulator [Rhodoligotrophos defluvii]
MAGLRERHQRLRCEKILDAAIALFSERGYEATRITEIAERAAVAPTTVYNYFATKRNIVIAIARRHVRLALPERRRLLKSPPEDPLQAISAYEDLLAMQSTRLLTKECWRVIFGTLYEHPGGEAHRTQLSLNRLVYRHYQRLIRHFQRQGSLPSDLDVNALASLVLAIGTFHWMQFLADDEITLEQLRSTVNGQLAIVLRGLGKLQGQRGAS